MGVFPILQVKPNGIPDVLDRLFVGGSLSVATLQYRAISKVTFPIFFHHDFQQVSFHANQDTLFTRSPSS